MSSGKRPFCAQTGKLAYESAPACHKALRDIARTHKHNYGAAKLNVFKCHWCGLWHLGTRTPRMKHRKRDRFREVDE